MSKRSQRDETGPDVASSRRSQRRRIVKTCHERKIEYQLYSNRITSIRLRHLCNNERSAIRVVKEIDDAFVTQMLPRMLTEKDTSINGWHYISGGVPIVQYRWPDCWTEAGEKYEDVHAQLASIVAKAGLPAFASFTGSWLFTSDRAGTSVKTINQRPHVDYPWVAHQHGRADESLPWIIVMPLSSQGAYLHLWLQREQGPAKLFIPRRSCLLLRSDVVHGGTAFRSNCPRVHFYCNTSHYDSNAKDYTEFTTPDTVRSIAPVMFEEVYAAPESTNDASDTVPDLVRPTGCDL